MSSAVSQRWRRPSNACSNSSVGQNRRDREWPKPRHTRFVWVSQPGLQVPPVQGLVVDWRRQSYRWSALVVTVHTDDEGRPVVVHEWVEAERLRPVKSDPNRRQLGPY